MTSFFIDPDIRKAETLPSEFYTRQDVFEAMKTAVFERTWHWVGDSGSCIPPDQTAAPLTLLEGMVNEPLLLVRQSSGAIKCLSNVCTHRGNLLVAAPCKARQLVCGYHGRRFELDGSHRGLQKSINGRSVFLRQFARPGNMVRVTSLSPQSGRARPGRAYKIQRHRVPRPAARGRFRQQSTAPPHPVPGV